MFGLVRNPSGNDARLVELRRSLDEFYASVSNYDAFADTVDNTAYHQLLLPRLRALLERHGQVTVLEYGAGKTSFARFLDREGLRGRVRFIAQDVTPQNEAYLRAEADRVVVGDVRDVGEPYHLAFSTFVLEHVADPETHIQRIADGLVVGGTHAIFCPNYELPGYLCPSLRHRPMAERALVSTLLTASRLASTIDRHPRFWVNVDPAIRHVPWYRDADAVYVVSRREIEWWHEKRGFEVERLGFERPTTASAAAWKWYLVRSAITTMVAATKTRAG